MRHHALRPVAMVLSVLFLAAVSAQADTIQLAGVTQVAGERGRQSVELQLRSVSQDASAAVSSNGSSSAAQSSQGGSSAAAPSSGGAPSAPSSITASGGASAPQQGGSGQVETIDLGDVTGTICDCGEIALPVGAFPKWPLLALGGIPFLFFGGEDVPVPPFQPPPPPPPPPTPEPIPEPTTLLLFGTSLLALGAGVRRQRRARKQDEQATTKEEV
jgi:PEP-CTERM motif